MVPRAVLLKLRQSTPLNFGITSVTSLSPQAGSSSLIRRGCSTSTSTSTSACNSPQHSQRLQLHHITTSTNSVGSIQTPVPSLTKLVKASPAGVIRKQSSLASSSLSSSTGIPESSQPDMPERSSMWTSGRVPPTPEELLETNQKWIADNDPELFTTTAKGQKPSIFWLGCCDSRVPAELVTGAAPGDLFVHRNIANTFHHKDGSALAALAYAINALGVKHVVVCGHFGCGGVQAAMQSAKERGAPDSETDEGTEAIQQWLSPIRALAVAEARASTASNEQHDEVKQFRNLVEKNVCAQVSNVASCSVIKNAWKAGKQVTVHGWVYDIATGKIDDLGVGEGSEQA